MVFDKNWFKKHQKGLLFLLNNPILKYWFRWIMRIHKDLSFKERIYEIEPNNYKVKISENKYRADFRTHDKFSKRLYFAFKPFWYLLHYLDLLIFDKYELNFNFGFSTLTVYPDASPETTSTDGIAYRQNNSGTTWADIRDGLGINGASNGAYVYGYIKSYTTTNTWKTMTRGFALFDISSIGTGNTISDTTLSFYHYSTVFSGFNGYVNIYNAVLNTDTTVITTDYENNVSNTTKYSTDKLTSSLVASAYNDFVFNATGLSYVSGQQGGLVRTMIRSNFDAGNTEPTWISNGQDGIYAYAADTTGTTQDPKLVVTYTTGTTTTNNIAGLL